MSATSTSANLEVDGSEQHEAKYGQGKGSGVGGGSDHEALTVAPDDMMQRYAVIETGQEGAEAARLRAVYSYAVLDTPPEPNFDRITNLAANIFDLPISTLCLADTDRHFFKSRHGVDATEMPRKLSFCDETLRTHRGFIVPDALDDSRFQMAPIVAGPPNVRFYAGTPLVSPNGVAIGSLCVLDTRPHLDFDARSSQILANLAGTVVELLEARSRQIELAACTEELAHLARHELTDRVAKPPDAAGADRACHGSCAER